MSRISKKFVLASTAAVALFIVSSGFVHSNEVDGYQLRTYITPNCLLTDLNSTKPKTQKDVATLGLAVVSIIAPKVISGLIGSVSDHLRETFKEKIIQQKTVYQTYMFKTDSSFDDLKYRKFGCITSVIGKFEAKSKPSGNLRDVKIPDGLGFNPNAKMDIQKYVSPRLAENGIFLVSGSTPSLIIEHALHVSDDLTAFRAQRRYFHFQRIALDPSLSKKLVKRSIENAFQKRAREEAQRRVQKLTKDGVNLVYSFEIQSPGLGSKGQSVLSFVEDFGLLKLAAEGSGSAIKVEQFKDLRDNPDALLGWSALPGVSKATAAAFALAAKERNVLGEEKVADPANFDCDGNAGTIRRPGDLSTMMAVHTGCFSPVTVIASVNQTTGANKLGTKIADLLSKSKDEIATAITKEFLPKTSDEAAQFAITLEKSFASLLSAQKSLSDYKGVDGTAEKRLLEQNVKVAQLVYDRLACQSKSYGVKPPSDCSIKK